MPHKVVDRCMADSVKKTWIGSGFDLTILLCAHGNHSVLAFQEEYCPIGTDWYSSTNLTRRSLHGFQQWWLRTPGRQCLGWLAATAREAEIICHPPSTSTILIQPTSTIPRALLRNLRKTLNLNLANRIQTIELLFRVGVVTAVCVLRRTNFARISVHFWQAGPVLEKKALHPADLKHEEG